MQLILFHLVLSVTVSLVTAQMTDQQRRLHWKAVYLLVQLGILVCFSSCSRATMPQMQNFYHASLKICTTQQVTVQVSTGTWKGWECSSNSLLGAMRRNRAGKTIVRKQSSAAVSVTLYPSNWAYFHSLHLARSSTSTSPTFWPSHLHIHSLVLLSATLTSIYSFKLECVESRRDAAL